MKKLITKLLAACLVVSLLPVSAFAAGYTVPDYAVTLNASDERIYEGDTVDISFTVNTDDFLMTDMGVGYKTEYFTNASDTTGTVEFDTPEIKGAGTVNAAGGYDLATTFTFTAKDVADTVKVDFNITRADIVYSYESARDNVDPNVDARTGTSVIIVKQYDVTFEKKDGTPITTQTIYKGLDEANEADTVIAVPDAQSLYAEYVGTGLEETYYEHVWKYNGNEYTDEEVAAFGQTGSANEITEDTIFVLEVRPQTFDVTVPADSFDTTATPDEATYGTDYTGKINPDEYDPKYDYTVKYEINGNEQEVECNGADFTIPGANITGDMILSFDKELNITINAYEYFTGHFLITVDGAAKGYTFEGHEMFKSENHNNSRAWVFDSGVTPGSTGMTVAEAIAIAEEKIFVSDSTDDSPVAPAGFNINGLGEIDISDAALTYGAYNGKLQPIENWVKEYLSADVDKSYNVDMDDYDMVVEAYKNK